MNPKERKNVKGAGEERGFVRQQPVRHAQSAKHVQGKTKEARTEEETNSLIQHGTPRRRRRLSGSDDTHVVHGGDRSKAPRQIGGDTGQDNHHTCMQSTTYTCDESGDKLRADTGVQD